MKKRNWTVLVEGYEPFPMILLDGELDQAEALKAARLIWPNASVS